MVTRRFSDFWISKLEESFDVDLWDGDRPADRSWILGHIKDKQGALVMLTDRVDREFLSASRGLRVVSTLSVGYDHIDVQACKEMGIVVTNTPDVLTDATADMGFALLFSAARRVTEGDRVIRSGRWAEKWKPDFMLGTEVTGKTLGILGMGRIGRAVAHRAGAFSMKVIYTSRNAKTVENAERVPFERLLAESDYLMACVSLNEETRGTLNMESFSKMKRSSIMINISRGPVVNENDLFRALQEGVIAGAALDVFQSEPLNPASPLISLDNIVLAPHLGSATRETRNLMAQLATENLISALSGEKPRYSL